MNTNAMAMRPTPRTTFSAVSGAKPASREPTAAAGTETEASKPTSFQSIVPARAWPITPDANPKTSVIRAVPMATAGSSRSPRMNIGEKNVAPPTPAPLARPAMRIAIGKRYQ